MIFSFILIIFETICQKYLVFLYYVFTRLRSYLPRDFLLIMLIINWSFEFFLPFLPRFWRFFFLINIKNQVFLYWDFFTHSYQYQLCLSIRLSKLIYNRKEVTTNFNSNLKQNLQKIQILKLSLLICQYYNSIFSKFYRSWS